jgi:transcriptional regulator with XRE-family HTH domain
MAKMIGVSPTYLSKIERDEFPPPAEDKVRRIAAIIGCDADDSHDFCLSYATSS